MADIICPNCKEPWEWDFVRFDLIHETNLDDKLIDEWDGKLTDEIRKALKVVGWEFGNNLAHFIRCESCPPGETTHNTRTMLADAMSDILGDDIDGFISEMEDAEYLFGDALDL